MEATSCDSGQVTALKRLENLPDFALPIYWDKMSQSDTLQVFDLDPSSTEYKTLKEDFKKTQDPAHPKHECSAIIREVSCSSIMKTSFNRSLAGQNATICGHGTYFAVNASNSASPTYAIPAADGTQLMLITIQAKLQEKTKWN
ncbi:hypothetical protein QQF64_030958 [Cirrhinus molitorella]|uniref:PARP catalytic domain-containing protein n=1 Tax=Cirrhinus molitorella TaxID=172907 RepID=A0ABR3N548_9TELE